MKIKPILCPQRLRRVPSQFSWIDQRLVRDRHITRCSPNALALYLLLCTVADAQGISYYSDRASARLLSLSTVQLREARGQLLAAGLIAYREPFYQVLSLEPLAVAPPSLPDPPPRSNKTLSLGEVLRQMMKEDAP
jgi:hypothetical protein